MGSERRVGLVCVLRAKAVRFAAALLVAVVLAGGGPSPEVRVGADGIDPPLRYGAPTRV